MIVHRQTREIVKYLLMIAGGVVLLRLSTVTAYLMIPMAFIFWMRRKAEYLVFLLMFIASMTVLNTKFFNRDIHFFISARATFFLGAFFMTVLVSGYHTPQFMYSFFWLYGYMAYIMVVSFAGWMPIISELKAILFLAFIIAFVQIMIFTTKGWVNFSRIRNFMLAICSVYILGSIALIPFPEIGRSMVAQKMMMWGIDATNEQLIESGLFNGMTWHSQTLGPLLAMLNVYLLSDYWFNLRQRNKLYWMLLLGVPVMIYYTGSRTALGGYIFSWIIVLFFSLKGKGLLRGKKQGLLVVTCTLLMVACGMILWTEVGRDKSRAFLGKTHESLKSLTVEDVISSRWGLFERGLEGFRESPTIGNGFQVSKEMASFDGGEGLKSLLSAPIEKGVLGIMILEEGGIIGICLFGVFLLVTYWILGTGRYYGYLACFSVMLVLNTGEATFFSISSVGGVCWMVCFIALMMDVERLRSFHNGASVKERYGYYPLHE